MEIPTSSAGDFTIAPTPVVEDVPAVDGMQTESALIVPVETAPTEPVAAELQATYSGTCGENLTWSLNTDTGKLTISGTGAMEDWSSYSSVPWYSYRSSVKSVAIGSSVTSIGSYAFRNCSSLTSVTIPDSVTSIGVQAFYKCTGLASVSIPDSVTSIGSCAFEYCSKLTSVSIGNSVTSIGSEAFHSCSSLQSVTIPDSVTSIGSYAFYYCRSLTSVTIPDSVTSIGEGTFRYCSSLTSVTYCGTKAQWNKIAIGSYNDELKNAARTYHTEHSWTIHTSTSPATCTEAGFGEYTCICGARKEDAIPALGHDLAHHNAKAATCEAVGWAAYDTCTRCDYTTRGEDIPATGHDYAGTVTTAATCTEDGVMTYVCSHDASHSYTEVIPALGHDPVLKQRVEPTQTAAGIAVYICSRCGKTDYVTLIGNTGIPGDANGDGAVNAKDVTTLRRCLAGGYGLALADEAVADVNKDGTVNAKDVTTLRRALAGGYGIVLS